MAEQHDNMEFLSPEQKRVRGMEVRAAGDRREAKRVPVDYLYSKLNWGFIKMMAQIAHYATGKYGAAEQYTESRLVGDKEPINHIFEHARQYLVGEPHDHFQLVSYQLAAIAYNAMMQYFYHICGCDKPNPFAGRDLPPTRSAEDELRSRAGTSTSGPLPYTPGPRQAQAVVPKGHVLATAEAMAGSKSLHARKDFARVTDDAPDELERKAKAFDRF